MFSTNAASQYPTIQRNSRRRQRPSDDVATPPKAKKQRPLLQERALEADIVNRPIDTPSDSEGEDEPTSSGAIDLKEIPFRGSKKVDSVDRLDISSILANNDYYSVTLLPSLPTKVRDNLQVPFRCNIFPNTGHYLFLTRKHAIVCPIPYASVGTEEVAILSLPETSASSNDLLPLGTLISASTHSEPGLIIVLPCAGTIVLWETVSNPTILGLIKQKESGIQDSIPHLLSGECVTDIVNIEPAGVVLILSTGRLCHVSTRDLQGKPTISFQFPNASLRSAASGFFEGLKNVFSTASWRRKVVAAKAGKSHRRGQRALLVATNSGLIEAWDTHWMTGAALKSHAAVAKEIVEAVQQRNLFDEEIDSYEIVDFAFREYAEGDSEIPDEVDSTYSLWVLASLTRQALTSYFVVEVSLHGSNTSVDQVYPVRHEHVSNESDSTWKPRLYVPRPGDTGFIVFPGGVTILSLVSVEGSPSSQLLQPNTSKPTPFQDYVKFRDNSGYVIAGSGAESDSKHPSCVLMVQNCGLIRISARPQSVPHEDIDGAQVSTRSRLEQLVFYETAANPVDLTCYEELQSPVSTLENAALQISQSILHSDSKFVPTVVPSLEDQMKLRSTALHALAFFLNKRNLPLSHAAKWTLLSHAEKMAAHKAVWKAQEAISKSSPNGKSRLEYIIGQMGEGFKTVLDCDAKEKDPVRHWFIRDTWRMELLIPWVLHGIRDTSGESVRVDKTLAWQVWQASELSLAVLQTVYQFREENQQLYGLEGSSPYGDGPVTPDYTEISALWTAEKVNFSESERLLDAELNTCLQWVRQFAPTGRNSDSHTTSIIEKIKQNTPKAFKVLSQLYMDRYRRLLSETSTDGQDAAKEFQESYIVRRKTHLYKMAATGLLEESMQLAEKVQDMDALVELMIEKEDQVRERHPAETGDAEYDAEMEICQAKIDGYFQKFGEAWATPFYTRQILAGHPQMLLGTPYQEHVTHFLRKRPGYAKLGWMNEILGENDYDRASKSLGEFAINHETDLWSKQVELAIGKLSRLATLETSEPLDLTTLQADVKRFDDISELARIQEMIYEHISPAIHGAIDRSAELQLANEQFGKVIVSSKPALREALARGLAKIIAQFPLDADELIDVLTLMDPVQTTTDDEDDEIVGHEFSLALRVLSLSDMGREDNEYYEILEKIIWRRCMIRDDWNTICKTMQRGDSEVEAAMQSSALFRTLEDTLEGSEAASNSTYRLYSPSDVTDPGIFPRKLASRLLPEQQAHLLDDLKAETDLLDSYIEEGKLEDWFSWFVKSLRGKAEPSAPQSPSSSS
ncbi:hypothetical protein LOZ66_003244 [Ophidiomyces ophidiicola]|nr:hypothetical protein LOZ66_003244 [Ophidiomyces ophidiicola]